MIFAFRYIKRNFSELRYFKSLNFSGFPLISDENYENWPPNFDDHSRGAGTTLSSAGRPPRREQQVREVRIK